MRKVNNMFPKIVIGLTSLLLVIPLFNYAQEKLTVEGAVILGNAEDASPAAGTIRWTGTDFEGWTGSRWVSLTSGPSGGLTFVKDIEANTYKVVTIGNQCWMADNLRTTSYNDGTAIPNIDMNTSWDTVVTPAFAWYNDNMDGKITYGALYNWYVVDPSSNGNKNVCPVGWHVPTEQDFGELINYLGGESVAGIQLKEAGNVHFEEGNETATNESGFTAIPGGYRVGISYYEKRYYAQYWTVTSVNTTQAKFVDIEYDGEYAYILNQSKARGNSIRCVKD
jgi:uncharacterized protein (TIGR02145 family)